MKVAAVGRFDREAYRFSPMNNPTQYTRKKITGNYFDKVNELGNQLEIMNYEI